MYVVESAYEIDRLQVPYGCYVPIMLYVLDPMIINGVTDFSVKIKHICKT